MNRSRKFFANEKTHPPGGENKSAKGLEREEWDFEQVPPDEIQACYVHEYGRELTKEWPRLSRLWAIYKQRSTLPRGHPDGWKARRVHRLLYRVFSRRFGYCPPFWLFPTAWQNVEGKERSELLEDLDLLPGTREESRDRLAINTLRELEASNVNSIEAFAYLRELFSKEELDQTEHGFFAINWNYGDQQIKDVFASWLRDQRQEREKLGLKAIKHRKTARGGFRDKLRCLGALRIVNHYPPGELSDYPCADNPNRRLKIPALYSHLPDLYEAAKKAQSLVDSIRATRRIKPSKGLSLRGNLEIVRRLYFPESG